MRKVPNPSPRATPTATVTRNPQGLMLPPETSRALKAMAMSEGSAMVVAKPTSAANR